MTSIEEKYATYIKNLYKAQKKYCETHRDQINEHYRDYYKRKSVDEAFKEKRREYAKASYYRKKQRKMQEKGGVQESQETPKL